MWYLGNRMAVTSEWVNEGCFPFPLSGNELVGLFVASNTISMGTRTEWACQGLGRVFILLSLSDDGQSPLDVVVTWLLPRCWVMAARDKIGKELKFVPSAQIWATDLPNSLVPGSDCCEDKHSCPFPKGVHHFSVSAGSVTKLWASENPAVAKPNNFSKKWPKFIQLPLVEGLTVNTVVMLGLNLTILKVLSHLNNSGILYIKKNPKQTKYCSSVSSCFWSAQPFCWVTCFLYHLCAACFMVLLQDNLWSFHLLK